MGRLPPGDRSRDDEWALLVSPKQYERGGDLLAGAAALGEERLIGDAGATQSVAAAAIMRMTTEKEEARGGGEEEEEGSGGGGGAITGAH